MVRGLGGRVTLALLAVALIAPGAADADTLHDQLCCGEFSILSQEFGNGSTDNVEVADDFSVPSGQTWSIDEVLSVWFAKGSDPLNLNLPSLDLVIYGNSGSDAPGSPLFTRLDLPALPQLLDEEEEIFEYEVPLVGVPVLGPGRYWLSLQARGSKATYGEWFWGDFAPQQGAAAVLRNPGNGLETGCVSWTRRSACLLEGSAEPDQSFILRGTFTTTSDSAPPPTSPLVQPQPKPKVVVDGSPNPGGGRAQILSVELSGPGVLSVNGKGLKSVKIHARRAGSVKLTLTLNAAGKEALRKSKSGKLRVKVKITFTPQGGKPITAVKQVTFKRQPRGIRARRAFSRELRRR